nr:hypothetical protein [Thioalkalivibrio paradoxus]
MRRSAFAPPRRLRQPRRQLADDGLRPFPLYASFIIGGGHIQEQARHKLRGGGNRFLALRPFHHRGWPHTGASTA